MPPPAKPDKKALSPEDRQMHVQLALLALAVMINILGFSLIIPLVPEYVQQGLHTHKDDPRIGEYGGWLTAVYALMQFLFAPLWGALSDRVGRKPILIGSLIGDAIFYTLFGLSVHSLAGQFAARILAGIFLVGLALGGAGLCRRHHAAEAAGDGPGLSRRGLRRRLRVRPGPGRPHRPL